MVNQNNDYPLPPGRRLARRDKAAIREMAASGDLKNRWFRMRVALYAYCLGFIAPPLFTPAGRAYRDEMKETQGCTE